MYSLNDKQIDHILSDIRARGVEMESLQQNLLDHVCCIIEQNLEENGDFESFYQTTIKTFYKDELWEIEEETLSLLVFKNYYTMKKIMIISGLFSALVMTFGIVFKFMHWPGAAPLLILGIGCGSLVFIPLLFTLRIKEKKQLKEKLLLATGALAIILLSLSFLFSIMHWPGANALGISAIGCAILIFLPLYFFSGIKHPDTKMNTIVSSILIILGCGLLLSLVNARPSIQVNAGIHANQYLQNSYEAMTRQNNAIYKTLAERSEDKNKLAALNVRCNTLCNKIEELKLRLINATEDLNIKTINYEGLGRLDNYDTPTRILFRDEPYGITGPELTKLKQELDALETFVRSEFKISSADLMSLSQKNEPHDGKPSSWEAANFYHTPLAYVLRNFTQLQLNIRFLEISCVAGASTGDLRTSK